MYYLVCLALWALPAGAHAQTLSGTWQVASLGGDREVRIEQSGALIAAHRILWPSFEGQKYKLEHLYRGTLKGQRIQGTLWVKDDQTPKFENLRDFEGEVDPQGNLVLDGLPLARLGQPSPRVPQAEGDVGPIPAANTTALPAKSLLRLDRARAPNARVAQYTAQGDKAFKRRAFDKALSLYRLAARAGRGIPFVLLERMGRTHLALKEYDQAVKWLTRALRMDPTRSLVREAYQRAVKENQATR